MTNFHSCRFLKCTPLTIIEPLSRVIRNKTGGVILFVINFLKSLYEEGLIYFNPTTLRWEYDLNRITQREVPGDVIKFLGGRIVRLPREVQAGLKIAACLGATFDLVVLQKAHRSLDFLTLAVENGFLQEIAPNQYTWCHDQLQEAAYSLIPMNKRESTHLLIGARIYLNSDPGEVQSLIHDIVRNMNMGMNKLDTQERKTELARLNLAAGEQSRKASAFYSAANYFMTGVGLLDSDWQNTSYDLAMKLFNSA
jgi:predicted ATPase